MTKLWGGRFTKPADKTAEGFTSSLAFDRRLYKQDIRGSIAHARMLGKQGIISAADAALIEQGLREIEAEIDAGQFPFRQEYEDIHLNIEKRLIEKIGPVAGRLHTARSRNDQVVTDVRLWVKEAIAAMHRAGQRPAGGAARTGARSTSGVIMPGYTHLQRAQPVLLCAPPAGLLLDAGARLRPLRRRLPAGGRAAAGRRRAGRHDLPHRPRVRRGRAGLRRRLAPTAMDAVTDRDFVVEFLRGGRHLPDAPLPPGGGDRPTGPPRSSASWSSDDAFATGSVIMPQKKNPDVAELVRGKTGRVYGNLMALLTVLKGLPLAYNRDLQEDKERALRRGGHR